MVLQSITSAPRRKRLLTVTEIENGKILSNASIQYTKKKNKQNFAPPPSPSSYNHTAQSTQTAAKPPFLTIKTPHLRVRRLQGQQWGRYALSQLRKWGGRTLPIRTRYILHCTRILGSYSICLPFGIGHYMSGIRLAQLQTWMLPPGIIKRVRKWSRYA